MGEDESDEYSLVRRQRKTLNDILRHKGIPPQHLKWQVEYDHEYAQLRSSLWKDKGLEGDSLTHQAHSEALKKVADANGVNTKTVRDAIVHAKGYNKKKLEKDWHPSDDQEPDEPPHF